MSRKLIKELIKESFDKVWSSVVGNKDDNIDELHVYDFDDTIVNTNSDIYIVNEKTGVRRKFHINKFHEHEDLNPDESFDMSELENIDLKKAELLPHFYKLKNDYDKFGPKKVAILTARPSVNGIYEFLSHYGIKDIEVEAIGFPIPRKNAKKINALRKTEWIRKQLYKFPIKKLSFYDDNKQNILSAINLIEDFPDIQFHIEIIKI